MTRVIEIRRVYAAPRERVWQAWTEPEHLARWWGKRGWTTPPESVTMDVRPGGRFALLSVSDEDGREMHLDETYREIVAVVTFADLGDGRTEMRFRTTIEADAALAERAAGGLKSAFERLDEHLKETP